MVASHSRSLLPLKKLAFVNWQRIDAIIEQGAGFMQEAGARKDADVDEAGIDVHRLQPLVQDAADVPARGVAFVEGAVEGEQAVVGLCRAAPAQPFGKVAQHGQGFFLGGKQGDEAIGIAGGDGAAFAQGEGFIGHVLGPPSIFGGRQS